MFAHNFFENNDRTISACFDPEHCTQIVSSCYNKAITLDIEFTSYTIVVSIMNE
jgi:hypothetical protein